MFKFKYINEIHSEKTYGIYVTESPLKLDKSKYLRFLHPKNIPLIFVTVEVSKLEKSIENKFEQDANISSITFKLCVLNFDISIVVNEVQEENNPFIVITDDVSILLLNFTFIKLEQLLNIFSILFTLEKSNFVKSTSFIILIPLNMFWQELSKVSYLITIKLV